MFNEKRYDRVKETFRTFRKPYHRNTKSRRNEFEFYGVLVGVFRGVLVSLNLSVSLSTAEIHVKG